MIPKEHNVPFPLSKQRGVNDILLSLAPLIFPHRADRAPDQDMTGIFTAFNTHRR